MPLLVADIGLDPRSVGAEAIYTYRSAPGVSVGQAYFVSLGARQALGFVLKVREVEESDLGFPADQLKDLGPKVVGLDLPPTTVELVEEVAHQTLTDVSMAMALAVPPGLRDRIVTTWSLTGSTNEDAVTPAQKEALRVLSEQGELVESAAKQIPKGVRSALLALRRKGLVDRQIGLAVTSERHRLTGLVRLTPSTEKVDRFLQVEGKKKPAQAMTVMRLQGSESASFTFEELRALGGITDQTLKALVQAGILEKVQQEIVEPKPAPTPNPHQQAAIDAIVAPIKAGEFKQFLLYGVTGSGKTEVYLRTAEEALKWGRQVLYLVPEIALTAQVVAQLRERFGRSVAVLHSNMTANERLDNWMRVRRGEAPVVLGARSALFAPFTNLGLVVVDEEHEASYKQENAPRYHARRIAEWMARRFKAPIIFGSATPSIESYYSALQGEIELLRLPERAAAAVLPTVHIEDLTESYKEGKPSVFSADLHRRMHATLARGEQVILFLNRRAYSPFLACRDCGHKFPCPQCAVSLAYHRKERKLKCHHCDHQIALPDTCPSCQGTRIHPFGIGAEKVEEEVGIWFPNAKVERLDRDIAKRKGALEEALTKFRSGAAHVLVGTQMVAKGLDFPNVTLVGVVAADVSLGVPDFRASERTFQLLSQVSGRAGRGQRLGEVVIQTLSADHPAVLCAQTHDFQTFFDTEIEERRAAGYPPFVRLINVLIAGPSRQAVLDLSAFVGKAIHEALPAATVYGPTDCPVERVQNNWRRHVLVKLPPGEDPEPIKECLTGFEVKGARLLIDVDPSTLL